MTERFLGGGTVVWREIKSLFGCGRKGQVAVAFLGQGSSKRLRLSAGSILVVNASDECIRSGQTDPREILKYLDGGIQVFCHKALHAKVFVTSDAAIIGSSNVSDTSESRLMEAALHTNSPRIIAAANTFVKSIARDKIGPARAKMLVDIYRPPRLLVHGSQQKKSPDFLYALPIDCGTFSREAEKAANAGRPVAKKELKNKTRFCIEEFDFAGVHIQSRLKKNTPVLPFVTKRPGGTFVYPKGRIVHIEPYDKGRSAVYFVETPTDVKRKRISLLTLRKRLGQSGYKIIGLKSIRRIISRAVLETIDQILSASPYR